MKNESEVLKQRTKRFAVEITRLVRQLPNDVAGRVIGNQVVRSATSVGANYRAACRARSRADFISKITVVEEEADETAYWLELIEEAELIERGKLIKQKREAFELTAIFTASGKTAKNAVHTK